MTAFGGIPQKAVIILILTGIVQLTKAQAGSIVITKKNNAGTITRQIDSSGSSIIWYFTKASTGWISTINYTKELPCPGTPTVYYAGQTYTTVQIGNQCWLKENINAGVMIPSNQNQTNNGVIEKYCYNDDSTNCSAYGGLYQWNEAMQYSTAERTQGICPGGWHIPTIKEIDTLAITVNQNANTLMTIGQDNGTTGFSALLAGFRNNYDDAYVGLGDCAGFWSSTESGTNDAYYMVLYFNDNTIYLDDYDIALGFSVRCVKN